MTRQFNNAKPTQECKIKWRLKSKARRVHDGKVVSIAGVLCFHFFEGGNYYPVLNYMDLAKRDKDWYLV